MNRPVAHPIMTTEFGTQQVHTVMLSTGTGNVPNLEAIAEEIRSIVAMLGQHRRIVAVATTDLTTIPVFGPRSFLLTIITEAALLS